MLNLIDKLFQSSSKRNIKSYKKTVQIINNLEPKIKLLSDKELSQKTDEFRKKIKNGATFDEILPEAFAVVRETSLRTIKLRHFDVQLIGGIVLHKAMIAEMKTGEGKTLVATLVAYLNSLNNDSVHIITVNDYLAERDAKWMGEIYKFLGLTVGCITSSCPHDQRHEQYKCNVVYATNHEIGFDYLRDNLKNDYNDVFFKKRFLAIVDEVDSILIDEARTPLAISSESQSSVKLYPKINSLVKFLKEDDFDLNEETKSILLTNQGMETIENLLKRDGLISEGTLQDLENITLNHHITQALRAQHLFLKDKDYIISEKQIVIIDDLTGRAMKGRRFGDGLHQAIEAKENLEIQKENQTIASITYQNFFRGYKKLCGMTGSAITEAEEFKGIYGLDVVDIPPNIPSIRIDNNDQMYMTKKEKYDAVLDLVKEKHFKNQPILIGTTSVENSEIISNHLTKNKIKHNVLNAKSHYKEAEIITEAGVPGNVTISTNMAGRGADIKLGGIKNNSEKLKKEAIDAGGLMIIGTERHESRRIDNQLRGRSGRQGDIGETIFFLSLEDDLMRIFGSKTLESVLSKLGLKEGEVITHNLITKSLERAQKKVESSNFDIRKQILKFDDILNDQRKIIYKNRMDILSSDDHSQTIEEMILDVINDLIIKTIPMKKYSHEWDDELLHNKILEIFNLDLPIKEWMSEEGVDDEEIKKRIIDQTKQKYNEKKVQYSDELIKYAEKRIMLFQIDKDWREHLAAMDSLRGSVNLRALGGKDPYNEYRKESFYYFEEMLLLQNEKVIKTLFNIELLANRKRKKEPTKVMNIYKKIPRNSLCPCNSGKKYKHCHGA